MEDLIPSARSSQKATEKCGVRGDKMGIWVATLPLPTEVTFKILPIYASLCHLKTSKNKEDQSGRVKTTLCKLQGAAAKVICH